MQKPIEVLTTEQSEKLLDKLKYPGKTTNQKVRGIRNHCIALLMLDAGLRVGEVSQLNVLDLWMFEKPVKSLTVRWDIAKGKHERIVPLTDRIWASLTMMWMYWWKKYSAINCRFAFVGQKTTIPINVRTIQKFIEEASLDALGQRIHPHILRHTFGTRLMRTTPMPIVQQLLGHKNLSSTQIYTHPNQTDLENAIKSISEPDDSPKT